MASLGKQFSVNQSNGKAKPDAIKQGSFYRITILSERLIRLEYSKSGKFNDKLTDFAQNRNFAIPDFKCEEDEKYLVITTKYFQLQYIKESPFKGPSFAPDSNLSVKLLNTDKMWYYGHLEARNYLGSAFSLDNFKNDVKLNKGLYSTDGFVTISDMNPVEIDENGILSSNNSNTIDLYLFMYRRDFGLCLKDYFTLTGYPLLIPRYALGIWWYRDKIYSFNDTKLLIKAFKENKIPISVLLLGEFWHTKDKQHLDLHKTGYTFNTELFPSPQEFTNYMHERGVRIGIQIDDTEGIDKFEATYPTFKKELGIEKDEVIPFKPFDPIFIANYFTLLMDEIEKFDIDFYWLNYKKDIKNLRAITYYQIKNFDKSENKRPMLMARNTGVASHRNGVLYSGETIVSWDTLKYLPFFNSSSSNIGLSWWSHDIGGYKYGIEDAELYMRYVQFATFSPIFRFAAERGAYYKREPWRWDFKTFNIVRDYCNLRYQLIPYIYTEAYKYSKDGMPLVQPLYYRYPEVFDEPDYRNEYFFGSEIFICPITNPKDLIMNRTIQRILLPKGTWYDFKTGKKYAGSKRYVTFFKDEDYPAFAKAGAIIPLANNAIYNSTNNPDSMDIHIFPGESNTYNIYEDDGYTNLYKDGYYIASSIDYNYMKNNYTVIIHPIEGKTSIIPSKRDYRIFFRNTKEADKVEVFINSEKKTNGIKAYVEATDFIVEVSGVDTTKQLTINCSGKDIEIDGSRIINDDINSIINDLKIDTRLKEELARIAFSQSEIKKKRIAIRKLKRKGLDSLFIRMFMKLYDYLEEL